MSVTFRPPCPCLVYIHVQLGLHKLWVAFFSRPSLVGNIFINTYNKTILSGNLLDKMTKWKSKARVTSYKLRVQIHELRVQIYELRVQIHELRVQIQELEA